MATLQQVYNLVYDARYNDLRSKVIAATAIAAVTVKNEDPATANHAARLVWATATLGDENALRDAGLEMYFRSVTDPTVQDAAVAGTATDAAIQNAVNARINAVAGS